MNLYDIDEREDQYQNRPLGHPQVCPRYRQGGSGGRLGLFTDTKTRPRTVRRKVQSGVRRRHQAVSEVIPH